MDMIYLITDNILFSSKIMANLKVNGVEASLFSTPATLNAAIDEDRPSVILANLNARTYDAIALVRALKAEGHTVIAFCGHADAATREAGFAAGADRVIANSAITMNASGALKDAGYTEDTTHA
jgi:DNA-binding response OmpR family regulator